MDKPLIIGIGELLWDMLPEGRKAGGAVANLIHFARQLGAEAYLASAVGNDSDGSDLIEELRNAGHDIRLIQTDADHPTGTVDVTLNNGQPTYTIHTDTAWDYIQPEEQLMALARKADAICFGSLCQRSDVSRKTIQEIIASASSDCLKVCDINLRQEFWSPEIIRWSIAHADILKLNDEELSPVADALDVSADPVAVFQAGKLKVLAMTRGDKGSLIIGSEKEDMHPGIPAAVKDTVGAGDSFAAALTIGLLAEKPLPFINQEANAIASFVCSRSGATPQLPGCLRNLL